MRWSRIPRRREEVAKQTALVNPPTAVMTRLMPDGTIAAAAAGAGIGAGVGAGIGAGEIDPADVAQLVPPVIPPLSAFAPLRDRLRDVAAQQKAKHQEAKALAGQPVPSHPATYSPTPTAAAPAAMPLPYQSDPYPGAPYQGAPYQGAPYQGHAAGGQAFAGYAAQPTNYPGQGVAPYQPSYPQPYQQPQAPSQQPPQYGPVGKPPKPERPARADGPASPNQQLARSLVLAALMLALAGLMALTPGFGLLVATLLIIIARTVDRGSTALMRRRQVRGGRGKSDGLVAAAASPVHLIAASLITFFCLILPVIVGFIVGGIVSATAASARGLDWQPLSAVGFATGGLAGLLMAWIGPGGTSLRRGSKIAVRQAFRPAWLSILVAALLLAGATLSFTSAANGGGADWARTPINAPDLPNNPGLSDIRNYPIIRDLPLIGG